METKRLLAHIYLDFWWLRRGLPSEGWRRRKGWGEGAGGERLGRARIWAIEWDYSLLWIIILFGWLKSAAQPHGPAANTMIGFAYFVTIITTLSAQSVFLLLSRQSLSHSDQGVQRLPDPLPPATTWGLIIPHSLRLSFELLLTLIVSPFPYLCVAHGKQRALGVIGSASRSSWAPEYGLAQ